MARSSDGEDVDVRVEPDRSWAWVAYIYWLARVGAVGAVVAVVGAGFGGMPIGDALIGNGFLVLGATFALGTPTALWWWRRPGRVAYVVRDGELLICRGKRVLGRFSCSEITHLRMFGALTWKELLIHNWFNYRIEGWPALSIDLKDWPKRRFLVGSQDQPAILLWGEARAEEAERDLRRAVVLNGAVLAQ